MRLWSLDDGELRLKLHEAQAKVWQSERRFTFYIAGTQSGKTSFGPWWLWREIRKGGAGDYLAVTASFDLFKLKMLPEMRTIFEHVLKIGRYWAGDKVIELQDPEKGEFWASRSDDPMWGRIILRSASAEGGLESATAQAAWLDEVGQDEFTLGAWEAVLRRLALSQGRVLGTTTPYNLGWLKSQVFDRWRSGDGDYLVVQAESTANPAFPRAEYERAKRTMTPWKFQMFYAGQFARPAGLIYGDYVDDRAGNLVAPFPIPAEWPRYVGLDFGGVNTANVWLAEDVDRAAYYLYREYLDGGKSTPEHARVALEHAETERVVRWVGGSKSEGQQRDDWTAAGVYVLEPEVSDVESGIDRVIQLLREKRLFVFEDCTGIRDEFGTYSRELDESGQPTEKIKNKERFHRLDALRYIAQTLVGGVEAYSEAVYAQTYQFSPTPY
jgi:hypothetical protein